MKLVVVGTGYVGLVTSVCLAKVGHNVVCIDVNEDKINKLKRGISPIYEEGVEELIKENSDRLLFSLDYKKHYADADVIFIAVGTPEREDGSANLDYVYSVCEEIVKNIKHDCVVVIKSTVPIGTNDQIDEYFKKNLNENIRVYVVSNPEFLAQGTAIMDTLYASRIIVGTEEEYAIEVMERVYYPLANSPYNVLYLVMSRKSAEMVKYASNDFLALKISYMNEISNLCEDVGADIFDVALGMSKDQRIGDKFLKSGIGYGGSCFPKDTKALHWLSKEKNSEIKTIKACIEVNKNQKIRLFEKFKNDFPNLKGMKVGVLGLSFKPKTDDLREAPSIDNVRLLLDYGLCVNVYDPLEKTIDNFRKIFLDDINYYLDIDECIKGCDAVFIMTEHSTIINYDLNSYIKYMKNPIIYDGRNCYSLSDVNKYPLKYVSMGRRVIDNLKKEHYEKDSK